MLVYQRVLMLNVHLKMEIQWYGWTSRICSSHLMMSSDVCNLNQKHWSVLHSPAILLTKSSWVPRGYCNIVSTLRLANFEKDMWEKLEKKNNDSIITHHHINWSEIIFKSASKSPVSGVCVCVFNYIHQFPNLPNSWPVAPRSVTHTWLCHLLPCHWLQPWAKAADRQGVSHIWDHVGGV